MTGVLRDGHATSTEWSPYSVSFAASYPDQCLEDFTGAKSTIVPITILLGKRREHQSNLGKCDWPGIPVVYIIHYLKATSRGSLKVAQNILFCGATSLTSHISTSGSSGLISNSILSLISLHIFLFSSTLSLLLVEKQYTWIIGSVEAV